MLSLINIIFWLNIIALSPICTNSGIYSIILRFVQTLTIIWGFTSFGVEDENKNTYRKISIFLWSIFLLNAFSELAHTSFGIIIIVRLLLHCLYIMALMRILPHIQNKVFCYSIIFLTLSYSIEFIFYIQKANIDPRGILSGNIEHIHLLKRAKRTLIDAGYMLSSIHIVPFLALIIIPYIKRKCMIILILAIASVCVVYSLTLAALIAFIVTLVLGVWFTRSKKIYDSQYVIYALLLYAIFVVWLNSHYVFDLYSMTTGRSLLWEHATSIIKEHWLFGASMNDFYSNIYGAYLNSDVSAFMDFNRATFDFSTGGCHNMYLNWAMNHGIPSFIVYFSFILFLWDGFLKRQGNMLYLLPFIYILIRGTNEASGFIDPSNGVMEFLVDIYMIFTITKHDKENCDYC